MFNRFRKNGPPKPLWFVGRSDLQANAEAWISTTGHVGAYGTSDPRIANIGVWRLEEVSVLSAARTHTWSVLCLCLNIKLTTAVVLPWCDWTRVNIASTVELAIVPSGAFPHQRLSEGIGRN